MVRLWEVKDKFELITSDLTCVRWPGNDSRQVLH